MEVLIVLLIGLYRGAYGGQIFRRFGVRGRIIRDILEDHHSRSLILKFSEVSARLATGFVDVLIVRFNKLLQRF